MDEVDIDAMLQEMAHSLPAAQDMDSSDEEVDEEEGESVTVFSRLDHLLSLGFHDSPLPVASGAGVEEGEKHKQEFGEKSSRLSGYGGYVDDVERVSECAKGVELATVMTAGDTSGAEADVHGTQTSPVDMDWDQFRTDFMEQLQSGNHKVKLEAGHPSAIKKHLLIKAISELQSQDATISWSQGRSNIADSRTGQAHPCAAVNSESQPTGDSDPVSLLSTSVLAGIEMSALDRALEEVEIGGANRTGGQRSAHPKLAWGESSGSGGSGGSDPDLISQLAAISKTESQELERVQTRERGAREAVEGIRDGTVRESFPPSQGEADRDEDRKKTAYVDLRSALKQPDSDEVHLEQLRQSTSESEESDDQMSWALKRRQIKSTLSPTHHNLHHSHRTEEPAEESLFNTCTSGATHSVKLYHEPGGDKRTEEPEKKGNERSNKEGYMGEDEGCAVPGEDDGHTQQDDISGKELQVGCAMQKEAGHEVEPAIDANNSPEAASDSVLQSSSGTGITGMHFEPIRLVSGSPDAPLTKRQLQTLGKVRQRNTESSTLSSELSSFSEGEPFPTKPVRHVPGAGSISIHNGNTEASKSEECKKAGTKKSKKKRKGRGKSEQKDVSENKSGEDSTGSSPEVGRTELGTKHSKDVKEGGKKKKDKDRKGEKRKEGGRKIEQTKKSDPMKAKIKRIRFDSLTTSSDEERGIDSPRLSRVEEVAEPLSERGEKVGGNERDSEERMRQRLEHKILSKKPPAMFETPATEPLFHQDVSFSPVLSHADSSIGTDALLILTLSSSHGLVSLPLSHPHISPEAHLTLHSLLVTYLAVSAAHSATKSAWMGKHHSASPLRNASLHSKLPLRITALYQTVLDGQLSILIGASLPQGRKRSVSYPSVVHSDTKRSSGTVLSPLDAPRNPFAIELEGMLYGLKLRDLLVVVMEGSGVESTEQAAAKDLERVVLSSDILNEIQPLLDLPTQAFFSVHSNTDPLTTPTSFYWHSLYQPSCLPTSEALCTTRTLQSTVCAFPSDSLTNSNLVFHAIHGAYTIFSLSIAGMRLVYGESCSPLDLPAQCGSDDAIVDYSVTLVLCLRGPDAVSQCMDLVGPEDYNLARVTDPCSIMARFGGPKHRPMQCTRTPYRVSAALSKWFGGRGCLHTGSVLGVTDPWTRSERRKRQRVRFSESDFESEDNLPPPTPDVAFPPLVANRPLLTVLPYEQVLLVVSPLLPPLCYSSILATCGRLGFDIAGAKRVRLNSKRATVLDIPASLISHFTPSSTPPSPNFTAFSGHPLATEPPRNIPPFPSLLLIVCRENALVQSCALKTAIIADLRSLLLLNPQLEDHVQLDYPVGALLHALPYNLEKVKVLGSFASTTVTSASSLPQLAPEWEKEGESCEEEISFLAVTQSSGLAQAVEVLQHVFGVKVERRWDDGELGKGQRTFEWPEDHNRETQELGGFELLGIKLIPQLSRFHAKQLCPIPLSDHTYQEAIQLLSDSPALILVFRGIACNHRLQKLLQPKPPHFPSRQSLSSLSLLTSHSLSQAFHYATMFFTDKELFCDPTSWPLLSMVPSAWARNDVLCNFQKPPLLLYSVLMVRGGEWRVLVKVVDRLCRAGFQVCGVTMRRAEERENEGSPESSESMLCSTRDNDKHSVCPEVAVCVSRQNAVWYLNHELRPFLSSAANTNKQNTLYCPTVFSAAVSLVQQFFPRGVCGPDGGAMATDYGVKPRLIDDFSGLRSSLSTPTTSSSSPLTENTCLILPPSHLTPPPHHPTPHYLQLLELVAQSGFTVTGIQMTLLSQSIADSLSAVGVDSKELVSGPCLILLLRRDNAASCFHYILKSAAQYSVRGASGSDIDELLAGAIVPDSPTTAAAIVSALMKEE